MELRQVTCRVDRDRLHRRLISCDRPAADWIIITMPIITAQVEPQPTPQCDLLFYDIHGGDPRKFLFNQAKQKKKETNLLLTGFIRLFLVSRCL